MHLFILFDVVLDADIKSAVFIGTDLANADFMNHRDDLPRFQFHKMPHPLTFMKLQRFTRLTYTSIVICYFRMIYLANT